MHARIAGLGQWFPPEIRDNSAWPAEFREASRQRSGDRSLVDVPSDEGDSARKIVARYLREEALDPFLGAVRRHVAAETMTSAEAEAFAGAAALRDAGVDPAEVDAIFSWALVPDRVMPSNACRVGDLLGARRAWSSSVDAACASPVIQLSLAAALIESQRARTVLLTQSHLVSRTFAMSHPAAPSVGDGASAMLVRASDTPGILRTHSVTAGEHHDAVVWCRGKDAGSDPPWWEPGGALSMGSRNPEATRTLMRDTVPIAARTVCELGELSGFSPDSIDVLCSVQPRRWVPLAIAEALGLAPNAAAQTYERYAHLGGVGPVVNLIAAREQGKLKPGARVVMYAQGAGFTRSAAALSW